MTATLPPLVRALLDDLAAHPGARDELRRTLALDEPAPDQPDARTAYTAATLAAELSVTTRAVRAAIARGDLHATKRGGRWIIARQAVEDWARPAAPLSTPRAAKHRRGVRSGRPMADALAAIGRVT